MIIYTRMLLVVAWLYGQCLPLLSGVHVSSEIFPPSRRELREKRQSRHTCVLHDGNCRYKVRLSQECHGGEGGDTMREIPHPVQSDYNLRVEGIEQNLITVSTDHTRRLSDLENRINVLLGGEGVHQSIPVLPPTDDRNTHGSHHRPRHGHGNNDPETVFNVDQQRSENELLNMIHDEFTGLREELAVTRERLRETERLLKETQDEVINSQAHLTSTTKKLLETEKRLRKKEEESATRASLILDKHRELNDTKQRLREMEHQLTDTQVELLNLKSDHGRTEEQLEQATEDMVDVSRKLEETGKRCEEMDEELITSKTSLNQTQTRLTSCRVDMRQARMDAVLARSDSETLKQQLDDCHTQLDDVHELLSMSLKKYHELNVKHENVSQSLVGTKEELTECFRGKTAQFCGFEDPNICGFTQDNGTDSLDWTRWNRKTPSTRTGPTQDHTCGNKHGYYMYLEATAKGLDQNARMITPRYVGHVEQCVEFYYHMYGSNIGTLNVYTKVKGQEIPPPVWRAYGNQGNVWILARLSIPTSAAKAGYQVVFEGILERGYQGDIAIDDIRVFDGQCQESPTFDETRREDEARRREIVAAARKRTRN